jgi:hypothetical protein
LAAQLFAQDLRDLRVHVVQRATHAGQFSGLYGHFVAPGKASVVRDDQTASARKSSNQQLSVEECV